MEFVTGTYARSSSSSSMKDHHPRPRSRPFATSRSLSGAVLACWAERYSRRLRLRLGFWLLLKWTTCSKSTVCCSWGVEWCNSWNQTRELKPYKLDEDLQNLLARLMLAGIEHGRVLLGVANWAKRFLREYGNLREQRLAQLEDFDQATHLVQLLLGHVAGVLNGN